MFSMWISNRTRKLIYSAGSSGHFVGCGLVQALNEASGDSVPSLANLVGPVRLVPEHARRRFEIEGKELGSLLIRQCTSGRSLRSAFLSLRFVPRLGGMGVDDCPN
jgi:hypothetical protein